MVVVVGGGGHGGGSGGGGDGLVVMTLFSRLRLSGRASVAQAAATSQPPFRVHGLPSIPAPAPATPSFLGVLGCIHHPRPRPRPRPLLLRPSPFKYA